MLVDTVDCEVLFMSGDSSIWERQQTIDRLSQLKSVILVATQVIEAGVDIDMDIKTARNWIVKNSLWDGSTVPVKERELYISLILILPEWYTEMEIFELMKTLQF